MYRYRIIQVFFQVSLTVALIAPFSTSAQDKENLMEMSLEDILNMKVTTASKSAEKLSDAPGILSVATKDELKRYGATTLKDVLERVPGLISTIGFFADRTLISIRGDQVRSNSGHVLLLINGRPSRDMTYGMNSETLETFPVNIIEKIEVVKGPGSVLYGTDAFSAVINIITEKADKNAVSVTGLAGNGGTYGTSGDVKLRIGDLRVVAAGRYYKKAEWRDIYSYFDYNGLANQPIDIPDKGPGAYMELDYKGLRFMSVYDKWTSTSLLFGMKAGILQWEKNFNNLGYGFKVRDNWDMDMNVTYTRSYQNASSFLDASSSNLVAEWSNSIAPTNRSKLVFGGLYSYNQTLEKSLNEMMPGLILNDANQSGYALYAQLDYRLPENLKFIGGLQANKVGRVKMNIVPRAGLIWQPVSRIGLKVLYSEAYKAPLITETDFLMPFIISGNPNLKSEKVSAVDVGLNYQGEQIQAGVNYFQSRQSNIIQFDISQKYPLTFMNMQRIDFQGVEFEGKYYLNRQFLVNGSVLYQKNEDQDGNKNVTPVANFGFKAGISYAWDRGITVSLFDIYQGDIDSRFTKSIKPYQGDYNLLHFYGRIHINRLLARELGPEWSLVVDVKNLLDKRRYAYNWGDPVGGVVPANPGRVVYVGLNASL